MRSCMQDQTCCYLVPYHWMLQVIKAGGKPEVKSCIAKGSVGRAWKFIDKKAKIKIGWTLKGYFGTSPSKYLDSDAAPSTSSAYLPNQLALTQKQPRALSSAVTEDAPQHKKGKCDDTI